MMYDCSDDSEGAEVRSPFIDADDDSQPSDVVFDESAGDSADESSSINILDSISSGLQRITQTGCIFSNAGVSLHEIIPVVFRLENMGRDPSEEELRLWVYLAESNISDYADYDGAALISIPKPEPQKRNNKGFSKMRTVTEDFPVYMQLYSVIPQRDLLTAFESAQKARRGSLSPHDLTTPRT